MNSDENENRHHASKCKLRRQELLNTIAHLVLQALVGDGGDDVNIPYGSTRTSVNASRYPHPLNTQSLASSSSDSAFPLHFSTSALQLCATTWHVRWAVDVRIVTRTGVGDSFKARVNCNCFPYS